MADKGNWGGMIRSFFSKFGGASAAATSGSWPRGRIVEVMKRQYDAVEPVGEDDGFILFAVTDKGVNFVVALITAGDSAVVEIGFLARFVGFPVDHAAVEHINRNLHLSVAGLEDNGDLYLLAGIEAAGSFDEGTFLLILEAWRRDLMLVLHALSGGVSLASAFPAARSAIAWRHAANTAPANGAPGELLKAFLGGGASTSMCGDCGGRGRRGLIARTCEACEGTGLVRARR
jgi:hypothetical protein